MSPKKKGLKQGSAMQSKDDVLGSYTGVAVGNCHDKPIQDADDL